MLAVIRRFAKTWPARALFAVLVGAFGLWGVAGRLNSQNNDGAVAHVGSARVDAVEAQRLYAQQIDKLRKQNGPEYQPPPAERKQIMDQVVRELVQQQMIANELTHLGVAVPDATVRQTTFSLAAFKGINGQFDRQTFLSVIQRNGLDEAAFIKLVRDDLGRKQLTSAVEAGIAAPEIMVNQIFAFARETRVASAVTIPFSGAQDVPTPTDAQLRRFWTNHPKLYATPEYRRIKVVALSAETVGRDMTVTDADIKTYYTSAKATYDKPERRSLEIVSAPDQALAGRMQTAWQGGLDWPAMQALARGAGATALDLPDAKKKEVPDQKLAAAAFSVGSDAVSAPVKGDFGWYVFKVTKITPASLTTLDQARDEIRARIGVLKANDVMDDRVNKFEDAMAGAGSLDALPTGLGVAAVEGTMDAQGNTPDGVAAPLPGFPELKAAIIAAAFKGKPGDPPQVEQVPPTKDEPAGGYYAVTVESITKPSQHPYDDVAAKVRQDWTAAQAQHIQESLAAQILTAARTGRTLASAAQLHGLTAQTLPPVPRPIGDSTPPPAGVPPALVNPLFTLQQGDATMVTTRDSYVVAQLQSINDPAPSTDTIGTGQIRQTLNQAMSGDAEDLLISALAARAKVTVNQAVVQQIQQP